MSPDGVFEKNQKLISNVRGVHWIDWVFFPNILETFLWWWCLCVSTDNSSAEYCHL